MSFLDEVANEARAPGASCALYRLRETDPDLHAEVVDALMDETLPASAISRALRARDRDVSAGILQYHRREDCARCR